MKRRTIFVTIGILLSLLALAVWPFVRARFLENSFDKIRTGDTKEVVLERTGAPWKDERYGEYLGDKPPGCVEDFIYAHPYAPYVPEYWAIQFDVNGHVISKVHLVSP